jgi:hypothetical protein
MVNLTTAKERGTAISAMRTIRSASSLIAELFGMGPTEKRLSDVLHPPREIPEIPATLDLGAGEIVAVRSADEIARTLDADGKFEGLLFMPEMLAFCDKQFRVLRRADWTCLEGQPRRIKATVHLDQVRCDGSSHARCQASCLLLWKEVWLRGVNSDAPTERVSVPSATTNGRANSDIVSVKCPVEVLYGKPPGTAICQATELAGATEPGRLGAPPIYLARLIAWVFAGRVGFAGIGFLMASFLGQFLLRGFKLWARAPWNAQSYVKTPSERLDLKPGEWVRVLGVLEILRTLDRNGQNRGMDFGPEMFIYCYRTFRVASRVDRLIDEGTRVFRELRNPCIVLESVYCHGQRFFCARGNYHYWREIWLRRC